MKIVLSKDAPEGQPLAASFGLKSFDAGKAKSFETDDVALAEEASRHPFFEVEEDAVDTKSAAAREQKENDRLVKAQAEAREYNANKAVWDDPMLVPRTLAELEEGEPESGTKDAPANVAKNAPDGGSK